MSIQEQLEIKTKEYAEAIRYMDNAKDTLKKAKKEGKYYNDSKYVSTACGTAYIGVLKALDCLFLLKGIEPPKKGRKSIEYYTGNLGKMDQKLLKTLNNAYEVLHLSGYYGGITKVSIVQDGLNEAYTIIEKIRP